MEKEYKTQWLNVDLNSMPLVKRKQCTYIRGVSRQLIEWFIINYQVYFDSEGADQSGWEKIETEPFALEYVTGLLVTLKRYKTLAWCEDPGSS